MPSNFAKQFAQAASQRMVTWFGEEVTYYPRGGGKPRKIMAKVYRSPMAIIEETGEVPSQEFMVMVKSSTCDGISSTEIDTGGDELEVALRVDAPPQRRSIARVVTDHNGLVKFMVQ